MTLRLQRTRTTLILFVIILTSTISYGQTYTTLADGDWDNTTTVWSTDGVTPCGCEPGSDVDGFDVVINHDITMTTTVTIKSGDDLTISATGTLDGATDYSLFVEDGTANNNGTLIVKELDIKADGTVDLQGPTTIEDKFEIEGEVTINSTLVVNNANITVKSDGVMNIQSSSEFTIVNGNLYNDGEINFDDACIKFTISNGDIVNAGIGSINGTGAVDVEGGGGIDNSGVWSADMQWCADGTATGMPHAEDCGPSICSATPLPVELTYFQVDCAGGGAVDIAWGTATETNNSHFIVERSKDALVWDEVTKVDGAGFSNQNIDYTFNDKLQESGTYYYRLTQVDFDNESVVFDVASVTCNFVTAIGDVSVFPNPASDFIMIKTPTGISNYNIEVINLSGKVLRSEIVSSSENSQLRMDISDLQSGIYIVKINADDFNQAKRLVVN